MIEILMTGRSGTPIIEAQLKLHPDTQALEDEWNGVTDPVLRRKLQNRLNQRAASLSPLAFPNHRIKTGQGGARWQLSDTKEEIQSKMSCISGQRSE